MFINKLRHVFDNLSDLEMAVPSVLNVGTQKLLTCLLRVVLR